MVAPVLLLTLVSVVHAQAGVAAADTYLAQVGSDPATTDGQSRLLHVLPKDLPLAVYVPPAPGDAGDAKRTAVVQAFRDWAEAAPDVLQVIFVGAPADGTVSVTWQDLSGQAKVGSYRYAFSVQSDGQYRFRPTEVILDPAFSPTELHTYALLEVGHALGLLGRSPAAGDAMSASPSGTLTSRDVATLRALYALPSGTALQQ
jgi:predicted Zn-dependent protease